MLEEQPDYDMPLGRGHGLLPIAKADVAAARVFVSPDPKPMLPAPKMHDRPLCTRLDRLHRFAAPFPVTFVISVRMPTAKPLFGG